MLWRSTLTDIDNELQTAKACFKPAVAPPTSRPQTNSSNTSPVVTTNQYTIAKTYFT